MTWFCDNDIILKIAACDLIEEMLTALDLTRERVRALPLAWRYITKTRRLRQTYTQDQVQRAADFVESVTEIRSPPDPAEHRLLSAVPGIDSGEVILFAATRGYPHFRVATGDKNCLRAVATDPGCAPIYRRLRGRVICFEQVLARIIEANGYAAVLPNVIPARACDSVLSSTFSAGLHTPERLALGCLADCVARLRAETAELLMP